MWNMLWPVLVTVLANVIYNICQKSTPGDLNAFGSLTVTYLVAACVSAVLFVVTAGKGNIPGQLHKLNWTSFVLGAAIIGLEAGYIFLYRAGWKISVGSLVSNISLAVVLALVGVFLYKETLTARQLIGMALCAGGLVLIAK